MRLLCVQTLLSSLNHLNGNSNCSVVIARFATQTLLKVRSDEKDIVHRHAVNSWLFMPVELGEFSDLKFQLW